MIFNDGNIRVTETQEANNLDIILGLNLPGFKLVLDRILKNAKDEICDRYYQNKINLRESQNEGEELEEDKRHYYDELNKCNNTTLIEIEKEEFVKLVEQKYSKDSFELNLFYNPLLKDYYTLYINNNLIKSKDENLRENINDNNENDNNKESSEIYIEEEENNI